MVAPQTAINAMAPLGVAQIHMPATRSASGNASATRSLKSKR